MGGKKGGPVLSSWIKEFCTLVFIQTIQAFIYAMIISLILEINFGAVDKVEDRNSGMAILAIIALTSVFKVEEMVKKIFGFGNTRADVRGAMSSIAKTAIAWNFGKRVLDNGAKVAGGIKAKQDAAKGRQKLKARMERDRGTFDTGSGAALASGDAGEGNSTYQEYYDKAKQAKLNGDMDGYRTNMGIAAGMKKTSNLSTGSANANNKAKDGKSIRDYNAMMDKYQDQLDELKKKRQEGTKQILRGLGETAGAVPGAFAGAIIGGADGNLDEALQGFATGAGIGDTIGGSVAESAYKYTTVAASVPSKVGDAASAVKKIRQAVKEQQIDGTKLEKARKTAVAYYKEATKNRVSEKELQGIIKKANEANADNAN